MQEKSRNRVSTHGVSSKVTRRKSPLENMSPANAAQIVLLFCKILLVIHLIAGGILFFAGIVEEDITLISLGIAGLIFACIAYIILSRFLIAPLMTWHFCKENLDINTKLLNEVIALRYELTKQRDNTSSTNEEEIMPKPQPKPVPQIRLKPAQQKTQTKPTPSA